MEEKKAWLDEKGYLIPNTNRKRCKESSKREIGWKKIIPMYVRK